MHSIEHLAKNYFRKLYGRDVVENWHFYLLRFSNHINKKLLVYYSPLLSTSLRGLLRLMFNIVVHKIHKIKMVVMKFLVGGRVRFWNYL